MTVTEPDILWVGSKGSTSGQCLGLVGDSKRVLRVVSSLTPHLPSWFLRGSPYPILCVQNSCSALSCKARSLSQHRARSRDSSCSMRGAGHASFGLQQGCCLRCSRRACLALRAGTTPQPRGSGQSNAMAVLGLASAGTVPIRPQLGLPKKKGSSGVSVQSVFLTSGLAYSQCLLSMCGKNEALEHSHERR